MLSTVVTDAKPVFVYNRSLSRCTKKGLSTLFPYTDAVLDFETMLVDEDDDSPSSADRD